MGRLMGGLLGGLMDGLLGRLFGRLRCRLWPDVGNLDNTSNFRSIGQKPLWYLGDRRVGMEVLNCLSQCPVLSGCYSYDCAYQFAQNCVNGGSTSITFLLSVGTCINPFIPVHSL